MIEVYMISHPGTGNPVFGEFEELMEKYFEGYNIPRLYRCVESEEFNVSIKRVETWLRNKSA